MTCTIKLRAAIDSAYIEQDQYSRPDFVENSVKKQICQPVNVVKALLHIQPIKLNYMPVAIGTGSAEYVKLNYTKDRNHQSGCVVE